MPRANGYVEIPIQSSNQPNVFVSAVFLYDDKLYQASKSLRVPACSKSCRLKFSRRKNSFSGRQSDLHAGGAGRQRETRARRTKFRDRG